ncbi:hypothetical protein [Xanthomonas sp. 1678]|uniref:hypothetical protein n=1 Tax=Xanthomonas sp. 1678 TaxID=3158788 RepID=UPI00286390CB|nr:hypothetical protein [Xanthomonas translucens]
MNKPKAVAVVAILLAGALSAACQKKEPESKSASTVSPLSVVEVRLGTAENGMPKPQTADAPILADVKLQGAARGQVLRAKLLDLRDGQQVGVAERSIDESAHVQSFRFENAQGWKPGRYMLEVTLDGKLASQQDVDVVGAETSPANAGS